MTDGETGKAPEPMTRLALRCWQVDRVSLALRSVVMASGGKQSWVAKQMAKPEGNWPHDRPLAATCTLPPRKAEDSEKEPKPHGPVPAKDCSCGIYATTDLDVINRYLGRDAWHGSVLGVVELGGRLIPATQGYRAAYARVAAILLVDEALTEQHGFLRDLAAAYQVPALVPHSAVAEDYRSLIDSKFAVTDEEIAKFFEDNR